MKRANCEHKILTILLAAVLLTPMFAEIGGPFSASTAQEPTPPPQLQYLEGSESSMLSVGYGVGGKTIAGASANGRIYFWDSVDNRLIAQLAGCTGPIVSTAPSPNGLQLASGSRNGLVRIFDIPTVHPLGTITGFAGLPTSIVVSPDGKLILTGDQSKAIRLWDGTNHQNLRNFASIEAITDIAMDTKQRIVFGTSIDGSLQGWNLDDGQLQGRVLTVASNALAAHPAGHTVALAGNDGVLRIVNWPPQPMRNIVQQGGVVVASAISHDDKLIVTGSHDQTVRTFNAETGAAIHSLAGHVGQSITVAISDDAKLIASGNNTGIIRFWQAADGADRGTLEGHKGSIRASVFLPSALNPDSPQLATAGEDGTLRIWNAPKSSPPLTGHSMPIASGKISGDGVSAVTVSGDQTLRYWNLADGKQTWASPALGQPLHRVAISPSDDQLATGDAIGAIRLHNAKDGAVEFTHGAHSLAVTGLAYGPEAKRLVTSGLDGLVKLWTLPFVAPHTFPEYVNGATNLTFVAQNQLAVAAPDGTIHIGEKSIKIDEAATSIAISPDGKLIAVGTGTGKVKVRVIATGAEAFQLTGHQGSVNAVMFHPKEAKIATAAADGSIGLWTIPAEVPENPIDEPLLVWQAHAGGVTCLTFTPDGTSLVSGGGDFSIRYWNSIDGVAIRAMTHGAAVTALSLVNKGTQVISASADKTVRIWNLSNGSQVTSIAMPTAIQRMTVNSDATRVATSGDDNIIRLWELASGRELEWFAGHTAAIQALDFSNDDKTLVSAAGDKTVRKWTIGIERLIVADAAKIHTLTLSPDGKQIVTGGEDKLVKQWDFEGKLVRQFAGAAAPVRCVSIRADGTQLAAGGDPTSAQANLIIWNFANGQSLRTVPTGAGITALAFNGNGKIAVAGADKHLRVYSPDDEQLLQDWTAPNVLTDIAIGPDHTTILTGCADNNSHQFHYSLVELLTGHVGAATGIAFTTDGKRVVSCGVDKTVRLWNREDGKQLCRFVGHSAPIHSLALSGDGKKLVTAGDDKIVRVWDMPANDAQPAAQIQPTSALTHTVIVRSVSITADGQVVATAGDDVFIRLWDVATGKEREQLTGHTAAIHTVRLSADGSTVVSGGADNFARQFFPSVLAQVTADETAGGKAQLRSVAFASDGATLFTSGMENAARQWKFNRPLKVEVEPDPATDPATAKAASPAAEAAEAAPDEAAADELAAEAKPLPRLQLEPALVFNGATTALTHVATSGNGRFLLTASGDAHLRIHDVAAGAVLATLKVPAAITSIAISKDGLKIVTGAADKIIRNYELAAVNDGWELKLFHESLGHTEAVVDVALAADTSSMVSVAADSTIQRWIAASAHPRQTFSGHSGPIYGLSWRADGLLLASGSGDKTVRVWNTQTSKLSFICEGHTGQVNGVDFHPSGTDVVSCSNDGTIRLWSAKLPPDPPVDPAATAVAAPKVVADPAAPPEPAPGDQIAIIEDDIDDALLGVAYSRDGNFLMSGGASKVWRQWNRGGEMPLQLQRDFAIHNYPIYRVVPSPNNSRFTTFDSSGKLFIWTVSNGALAFHQQLPTTTGYGIAYSPNSEEMVVATRDHRVMRIIIPPTAR